MILGQLSLVRPKDFLGLMYSLITLDVEESIITIMIILSVVVL